MQAATVAEQGTAATSSRWPWLPFVELSLAMALVPGFLLGGTMLWASARLAPASMWYAVALQAHGHAQLLGWGGAMILGVALHFLPRVRGAKQRPHPFLPVWFWLFTCGLALRVVTPPLAALVSTPGRPAEGEAGLWRAAFVAGQWVEAVAVVGLVATLVVTLRDGPPLAQKKAFAEMRPLLVVSGGSLLLAEACWTAGVTIADAAGRKAALLVVPTYDRLAVDVAAFGFITAISLAMSARLFPLFFRLPLSHGRLLRGSAGLLAGGTFLDALGAAAAVPERLAAWGHVLQACGLLIGVIAVRIFARRQAFLGDRDRYRLWRDPAGLTVVSAYAWACLAAVARLLQGLDGLGFGVGSRFAAHDLALHAVGAGFMSLLILGVGHVLLPGFGGAKATPRALAWCSLVAGDAAVFLRVLPAVAGGTGSPLPGPAVPALFAAAGLAGTLAVAALALGLWLAWHPRRATAPNR